MGGRTRVFTRRDFLAGAAAAAAASAWPRPSRGKPPRRPHILLIQTDDHHPAALGCMGHPALRTPHIDAIAARGTLFTQNVCQAGECIPSRISLLTGSYPHNEGVYSNRALGVPEQAWTFPSALRRAGYRCVLVGKNHLGFGAKSPPGTQRPESDPGGLERFGFDEVFPVNGKVWSGRGYADDAYRRYLREQGLLELLYDDYVQKRRDPLTALHPSPLEPEHTLDAFIAGQAIRWLDTGRGEAPFLLWVNFVSPHTPCDAPLPYARMYDPKQMPEPIAPGSGAVPPALARQIQRYRGRLPADFALRFRAAYAGMISFVDAQVGRLLAAFEQRELLDDTLVVFCADQGQMAGDHGLFGKGVFYRGAIGAPLVVSWPGGKLRSGARVEQPVELQDLVPTFLELAAASHEDRSRYLGRSLLPVLRGQGGPGRSAAFAEKWSTKMIQTAAHKYVYHPKPGQRQLFDLREDPDERHNLAGLPEHARVEQALRDRILMWLSNTWRQPNSLPPAPPEAAS